MTIFSDVWTEYGFLAYVEMRVPHALLVTHETFTMLSWPCKPINPQCDGGSADSFWCGMPMYVVKKSWFTCHDGKNFQFVHSSDTVIRALVHAGRVVISED